MTKDGHKCADCEEEIYLVRCRICKYPKDEGKVCLKCQINEHALE